MTIHADFFKIVKEGCGKAFSEDAPVRPDTVFIDGQVKLMKAAQVDSWGLFYTVQFFKTIENCFALGASTVVLGFDDYKHVPVSKTMTQVKRAKQKVVLDFLETACLPAKMPQDWGGAMANRSFKVKVISKVLEATTNWFTKKMATDPAYKERNLVLDYIGTPVLLRMHSAPSRLSEFIREHDWTPKSSSVGRGECDIKAFVWLNISRCLCIVSTDGDYLPLALLQTSNAQSEVLLYRMTTQTSAQTQNKRKLSHGADPPTKSRRTSEFVRISPVASWIATVMPSRAIDPVRQFCALVALCGCDFSRNLPRLGPRTLWKLRHRIQHIDLLQAPQALAALCIAYTDLFIMKNTVPEGMCNRQQWFQDTPQDSVLAIYSAVAAKIQSSSKVPQSIKEQIWTRDVAMAHARNTVWTMHYWSFLEHCPDPHTADFGYVLDAKGRTHFAAEEQ